MTPPVSMPTKVSLAPVGGTRGRPSESPRRTAARSPPQAELSGALDLTEIDSVDQSSREW